MKKILGLIFVMAVMAPVVMADTFYGKSTEWVTVALKVPLDSGGLAPRIPDSCHVATWASPDSVGQLIYSSATTTLANFQATCHVTRDTLDGAIYWNLKDSIGRLNAGSTSRQIVGQVVLWWKGAPTTTLFTLYVLSAQTFVSAIDSVGLAATKGKNILDSIQVYDDGTGRIQRVSDTANMAGQYSKIRDTAWKSAYATTVAGSYADSLKIAMAKVKQILDTLQLYDTRFDSLLAASADAKIKTQVNQIRDTILLYDTRFDSLLAASSDAKIKTQVNQIRDTVLLYDTRFDSLLAASADAKIKTQVNQIRDTVLLYDTRFDSLLAAAGNIPLRTWNIPMATAFTAGSMGDSANNNGFYGAGGGTGLDSATTSRILKRTIWGVATGSGSDSTTAAERVATAGSAAVDTTDIKKGVQYALRDNTFNMRINSMQVDSAASYGKVKDAGTEGAFQVTNATGPGMYLKSYKNGYAGLYTLGKWGASGIRSDGIQDTSVNPSHAIYALSTGNGKDPLSSATVLIVNQDTISNRDTAGAGLYITSTNGDAIMANAGGTDTSNHNRSVSLEGMFSLNGRDTTGTGRQEGALDIYSVGTSPTITISSGLSKAIRISKNDGTPASADTAVQITGGSYVNQYHFMSNSDSLDTELAAILARVDTVVLGRVVARTTWGVDGLAAGDSVQLPRRTVTTILTGVSGIVPGTVVYATVFGQSMRRDSLRASTFDALNLPSTGTDLTTPAKFNRILDRGVNYITSNYPALERFDTTYLARGAEGGDLPVDFAALKSVYKMIGYDQRIPMEVVPYEDTLFDLLGGSAEKAQFDKTSPEHPRWFTAHGGKLLAYPKFDKSIEVDSLFIEYYAKGPQVQNDTQSTPMDQGYREALIYYCCARLCEERQDFTKAAYYQALFEACVSKRGFFKGNVVKTLSDREVNK